MDQGPVSRCRFPALPPVRPWNQQSNGFDRYQGAIDVAHSLAHADHEPNTATTPMGQRHRANHPGWSIVSCAPGRHCTLRPARAVDAI